MRNFTFIDLNSVAEYLLGCLKAQGGEPGDRTKISDLRNVIGKLFQQKREVFTLKEVMAMLPREFQIGQPKCDFENLLPLLLGQNACRACYLSD